MNPDNLTEEVSQELEQRNAAVKEAADKQSRKYFKKFKREMDRLQDVAKNALISNQPESYKYAVGKLRSIAMQTALDADTMHTMWLTSKTRCDEMFEEAIRIEQEKLEQNLHRGQPRVELTPVCSM